MPRGHVIGGGPGIFGPELVPLPGSEDTLPTLVPEKPRTIRECMKTTAPQENQRMEGNAS